jgi:hypothetical protein
MMGPTHTRGSYAPFSSALSYRGEACQHLDLDLVGLEVNKAAVLEVANT